MRGREKKDGFKSYNSAGKKKRRETLTISLSRKKQAKNQEDSSSSRKKEGKKRREMPPYLFRGGEEEKRGNFTLAGGIKNLSLPCPEEEKGKQPSPPFYIKRKIPICSASEGKEKKKNRAFCREGGEGKGRNRSRPTPGRKERGRG